MLVTHYRNVGNNNGESSGIAMGLALLEYLGTAKWLAKDIVLLLADGRITIRRLICRDERPRLT